MLSSLSFKPTPSNSPNPSTGIALKISFTCFLAALAFCLLIAAAQPAQASGSLSTGQVQDLVPLSTCPGGQWFSYHSGGTTYPMNCVAANLRGCSNVEDLGFTFGYLSPAGIIPGLVQGVIAYFDGGDGTTAAGEATELQMMNYYFQQGYEVVEVAWSSAWEAAYNPFPPQTYGNVQNAACRPATFLNYVYTAIYQPITTGNNGNPKAGMCAQGYSAGSAAIGYSLAYYGAGSYLDNVELISGPVMSDIKQGCQEPAPSPVTVCPPSQTECQLGGGADWTLPPTYVLNGANYLSAWTNDNSCTSSAGTSAASNSRWLAQSIVDQAGVTGLGATPSFSYPNTAMTAWLCRSVQNPPQIDCATSYNYDFCPNNSSPQGQLFYTQVTDPPHYNVYAVDNCFGPEGVPQGDVAQLSNPQKGIIVSGATGIQQDMAGAPGPPPKLAQCFHGAHTH
jgi:hypothetical protein